MIVLPSVFLYRMLRNWRWSLRTWLGLPLVVAVMIMAYYFFGNRPQIEGFDTPRRFDSDNPAWEIAFYALTGAAILPFPWLLVRWSAARRWRPVALLVAASLIVALVVGYTDYLRVASRLDPLERFHWTAWGWWNMWLPSAVITGWLALAALGVGRLIARLRNAFFKRRPSEAARPNVSPRSGAGV